MKKLSMFLALAGLVLPRLARAADAPATGVTQGAADEVPAVVAELQDKARSMGLDPDSPTLAADVQQFVEGKAIPELRTMMQGELQKFGLPANASWQDVVARGKDLFAQKGEDSLLGMAQQKLGLGSSSSWNDVAGVLSERARSAAAGGLGLDPKTASWSQIAQSAKAAAKPPKGAEKLTNTLLKTAGDAANAVKPKLKPSAHAGQ